MSLVINHNLMAYNTNRNLNNSCRDLSNSVRRLSSGLRVSIAADDAAGLAIRELMRADIASNKQGVRNANDAISLIQTADGALGIIDEKLIRMKELAEQAATGTYSSDQRIMIDSEFQAMGAEINRIANATNFNGVHLLNGNLSGTHDGSALNATGALKVHFGTGNDSAEDYYYISIGDSTLQGLGLSAGGAKDYGGIPLIGDILVNRGGMQVFTSGLRSFGIIPKGTKNVEFYFDSYSQDDSMQILTTSGKHIVGTTFAGTDWSSTGTNVGNINTTVITAANGFDAGASYDGSGLNGTGTDLPFTAGTAGNSVSYGGMTIDYSGNGYSVGNYREYMTIAETTEDLIVIVVGSGQFEIEARWDAMPAGEDAVSIRTQAQAQRALERIDDAIIAKDTIRADLGAMQNRLENTASNLQIQAENLQSAESRISDTDVAAEMTSFTRNQILTQAGLAMAAQANSLPQMALQIIQG